MPASGEILSQLTELAVGSRCTAGLWHVAVIVGAVSLVAFRWRPHLPAAASLAAMPLLTASLKAFTAANLFNGVVLAGVFVALVLAAARLPELRVDHSLLWSAALGVLSVVYAFAYPHFVPVRDVGDLLYTPMGVLPCPSLALVVGLGLLAGGFGSARWSILAGSAGAFYALVGMFRLGVWLDVGLLLAASALVALGFSLRTPAMRPVHAPRHAPLGGPPAHIS